MKSKSTHIFFLFTSMVVVLVVTYISDRWINLAILHAQNSFGDVSSTILAHPIGQLIIVGMCIFLYWFVIQKSAPYLIVSLLYLSVGLLLLFYNVVIIQFSSLHSETISFLYPFSYSNLHLTAGAFIILIGFINLFRYRTYSSKEKR